MITVLHRDRIGYVLSLFPCYDETFILREMKALRARGVPLTIFSLRRRRSPIVQEDARPLLDITRYGAYFFSREVLSALGRCLRARPRRLAATLARIFRGCWRHPLRLAKTLALFPKMVFFAEAARAEGIGHLHAHWATHPATAAMVMSELTGIPWSFTCHAHDIFLNPILLTEKLERAELVLTCTGDNKRYLETLTPVARSKVRVSYHGLDLRRFRPRGQGPGSPSRAVEILAVGSLLQCKGFDILLEACGMLQERRFDFHLTVAGGGPEERRLRSLAAELGLSERVRWTGYATEDALIPLYQEADLFVLPAVLEIHWGIPNVLVEALACGVPVVTTGLPSLPELVEDGVHGLVAENRNPRDVAEKIARLLSSPELRRAMGRAGRKRVASRFDIERTIEDVVEPLVGRNHVVR